MDSREKMVDVIRNMYGLDSPKVLNAMLQVPREKFVSKIYEPIAHRDGAVSIGRGQTMSQPYTVAFMTHLLVTGNKQQVTSDRKLKKILEIGTGSGYQAAVLSYLVKEVYTVEIIPELARSARRKLKKLGYKNVFIKEGSGEVGWPEKAPFDAIVITAGVEKVPKTLFEQLKIDGVLVAPVGKGYNKAMTRYTKKLKNSHFAKALRGKQGTKGLKKEIINKEEFDIFHFVPFVERKS